MAIKCDQSYGGYDLEFVDDVPDRFICQICTRVLRDPHLAVCCGQHFCESCLKKWFKKQAKKSCPHCRAQGSTFNHVIHKGMRSEISQLKIKCTKLSEGCEWRGELGELETHLESDDGCDYVNVACPNKCRKSTTSWSIKSIVRTMKRKDLHEHLDSECYLRPYHCEYCGRKSTYDAIMGRDGSGGHQAKCPEAPLMCPNKCRSDSIKRKDMVTHCSQCPQEPVECPFAEAGCKEKLVRYQFEDHINSSQQQHLLLIMKDYGETKKKLNETSKELSETRKELSDVKKELFEAKKELSETKEKTSIAKNWVSKVDSDLLEVKGTLTTAIQLLCQGLKEADKEKVDFVISCSSTLRNFHDSVKVVMPKFSEYRRSGKVWHSPPFYYRESYKMCLEVYANGVGEGAGTHCSVSILLLDIRAVSEYLPNTDCRYASRSLLADIDGHRLFKVCFCQPMGMFMQILQLNKRDKFCSLMSNNLHSVSDTLTLRISYVQPCCLLVHII